MKKDKDCRLAYDLFVYETIKVIGSYIAVLNGLDNLVFTGAIGENVPILREDICNKLKFIDLKLNDKENHNNKELISSGFSKVKVYVRKSNEERIIIEEVLRLLK